MHKCGPEFSSDASALSWLRLFSGGILGATLVRFAPGFGVDERELTGRAKEWETPRFP